MAPLLPLVATFVAILVLEATEDLSLGGSPFGLFVAVALVAAHLPLVRVLHGQSSELPPAYRPKPATGLLLLVSLLVAAVISWTARNQFLRLFESPISAGASSQLGVMLQAVDRFRADLPLYGTPYAMKGYELSNQSTPGLVFLFLGARMRGFDPRFVTLGATLAYGALVAWGASDVLRKNLQARLGNLALGAYLLAAIGWFFGVRFQGYFDFGCAAPTWPLVLLLGLSVAGGHTLVTALSGGLLGALSPGWLLLTPLVAALVWRRSGGSWVQVLLVILIPTLPVMLQAEDLPTLFQSIVGGMYGAPAAQSPAGEAARYATLHGLAELLGLRPLLYTAAILVVVELAVTVGVRPLGHGAQAAALAGASLVVLVAAPVSYFHNFYGHAALLAGLLPAWLGEPEGLAARPPLRTRFPALAAAGLPLLVAGVPLAWQLKAGFPAALNRKHTPILRDTLLGGWNWDEGSQVWAKESESAVRLVVDRARPARLRLSFGTMSGDWVPRNPIVIRLNGHEVGKFDRDPGDFSDIVVDLAPPSDLYVGANELVFQSQWTRTPRSLGVGSDDRRLAFCWRGVEYLPATEPPGAK